MPSNKSLTVTVIVLGVIAAIAIGSAATLWMTRRGSSTAAPQTSAASPAAATAARPETSSAEKPDASAGAHAQAEVESTGVFINDKELKQEQVDALMQTYGAAPPKGKYWYDPRSGLFGYWGYEAAGYIRPDHNFGALSARASRGNTRVFLNGREINMTEAAFFQRLFGVVYQGHFWLDGHNGNMGVDGNPTPLANLVLAMRQAQQANQGGYHWRDGSGGVVSSEGNCTFAAIPGAPVYSTPGCG